MADDSQGYPNGLPLNQDVLKRAFYVRLQASMTPIKDLVEEHREKLAWTLLSSGIMLIPSEYLQDNQFVVSQAVYETAKRITGFKE